VYRN
jgi:hypothetical protein